MGNAYMNAQGIGMTSDRTRARMIERLRKKGITDERVLNVMGNTPRHLFIDEALAHRAYEDTALPIQHGQTISQPYVVAQMTSALLKQQQPSKVLELGTGCGYQAAILSPLVDKLFTIERIDKLTRATRRRLLRLGYSNIRCKTGDGFNGWPNEAPFDAIICTAAPEKIPESLLLQLKTGGIMVMPVGNKSQQKLVSICRTKEGLEQKTLGDVIFVPLLEGVLR